MVSSFSNLPREVIEDGDFEQEESFDSSVSFASIHSFSVFEDEVVGDESFDNYRHNDRDLGGVKGDEISEMTDILEKLYLGCGLSEDIEKKLTTPGTLGLYHRQSGHSVEHQVSLFLHIVYYSSDNAYKHYPIDVVRMEGRDFYQLRGVEKRHFSSMAELVSFYHIEGEEFLEKGERHFGPLM